MTEGTAHLEVGTGAGYTPLNTDHSVYRALLGWLFLETLAPKETLERG